MDEMEDVQMTQQGNAAHQYQCQRPQLPPTAPAFTPHPRHDQHYDPVHEANQYYQTNNASSSSRPQYQVPPPGPMPNWQPSYVPIHNWQSYPPEPPRSNLQSVDSFGYATARPPFMDRPWNEVRGYDQMPFGGYGHYSGPLGGSELGGGPSNSQPSGPSVSSQLRGYNIHAVHPDIWQRPLYSRPPPATPHTPSRTQRNEETSANRPIPHQQAITPSENHRFSSNPGRRSHRTRGLPVPENWPASRRFATHVNLGAEGVSDEDDDDLVEADYRRQSDLVFDTGDDERTMAAMRGVLADGKKVASRDFLKTLENVPIDQVPESERNCSICYETIGTPNLEGLTEKAVRLPQCKHIFGDLCFKKWCQDSDTCPYCRDKLPSELSVTKKSLINEYRIIQRERLRATERARRVNGLWLNPPHPTSAEAARIQEAATHREIVQAEREEVEHFFPAGDPWVPWTSRYPGMDGSDRPSDRRRSYRGGRLATARPSYSQGRPTSVGSSRLVTSTQQNNSQRPAAPQIPGSISPPNTFGNSNSNQSPQTPGLTRQSSNPGSSAGRTTSAYDFSSPDLEEASPPVAVGSGGSARDRQIEGAFRRSLDHFTAPRSDEWVGSPPQHSPTATISTLGSPFHGGIASPLRQHPTSDRERNNSANEGDNSVGSGPSFNPRWSR